MISGFGVALASVIGDTEGFSLIMQLITFPTFLLSGALFPIQNLPSFIKFIVFLDPLTYGVDGLRGSLISFSQFPLFANLLILLVFDLIMVFLGTWLFNKTEV